MRDVLIIGCNGQLGADMMHHFPTDRYTVSGMDFPDIDIVSMQSVVDAFDRYSPQIVINCAAYTAVDKCETERDAAFAVNAQGVGVLGKVAQARAVHIVHISTDYIFDGNKKEPYIEIDQPNPQSVYGESKYAGEKELIQSGCSYSIFRIAWLYGSRGNNFAKTIRTIALQKAQDRTELRVVNDQHGTPTYTVDVCKQIIMCLDKNDSGLFHCTNEGACTWYDFAKAIVKAYNIPVVVSPCTTQEFIRPAPRPANSVLENQELKKLGHNTMRPWESAFADYVAETLLKAERIQ